MISKEKALDIAKNKRTGIKLIDSFEAGRCWAFVFAPEDWDGTDGIGTAPTFVDKETGDIVHMSMTEYLKYL